MDKNITVNFSADEIVYLIENLDLSNEILNLLPGGLLQAINDNELGTVVGMHMNLRYRLNHALGNE